jgi:hypothetical protein
MEEPAPTNDGELLRWLVDRARVVDCVVRFANAFDSKHWDELRACLDETLWTDYSQFRGETPERVAADAYVAARRMALADLGTLHFVTNHDVRVDGDVACCRSAYRISRIDPKRAPGEDRLDTAGTYEHGLVRRDDGWRIDRIRQTVVLLEGNREIHGALRGQPRERE